MERSSNCRRLAGTAMAYLFEGILLPNDYGGKLRVSDDGNSIENGPEHSKLVYASLKNLVPARALQSLIYDHYEKGTRVYQDTNGDLVTMPASTDGTDQSKITLRRAKQLVAGWLVISTAPTYQGLASVVEDANDSDTVVICPLRLQPGGVGELSTMDDDVIHEVQRNELIFVTSSSRPLTRSLLEKVTKLLTHIGSN
ncbi:hypothetical protein Pmar_PMAR014976 [Perkinsus marinus ATCC 50983]|uniref:Uncharacterized protein n=3 Tax=Perkinsus marinus (strain ATCC 50983 / TXsc) TaxID=423536 RepID=C5LFE3_PERM5|nr:hypothetical protein Pmar_PMAR014976 [Perkinsus marinus ATCC 50983]EER04575.1 hypothetical protein Pmar_PMAR014976 [Perkinsus marinus ATCC 50983]|eukprot:XP_002772759.1 hypothetical protein Pmar_PMAR014976 [Perkinsus marinus ATCC 50983]